MTTTKQRITALDITALSFGAATLLSGLLVAILTILIQGESLSYLPTALAVGGLGIYVLTAVLRELIRISVSEIVTFVFGFFFFVSGLTGVIGAITGAVESIGIAIPAGAITVVAAIVLVTKTWDVVRAQRRRTSYVAR